MDFLLATGIALMSAAVVGGCWSSPRRSRQPKARRDRLAVKDKKPGVLVGGCVVKLERIETPDSTSRLRVSLAAPGEPIKKVYLPPPMEVVLWHAMLEFEHVRASWKNPLLWKEFLATRLTRSIVGWSAEQLVQIKTRELGLQAAIRKDLERAFGSSTGAYHLAFRCIARHKDVQEAIGIEPFYQERGIQLR